MNKNVPLALLLGMVPVSGCHRHRPQAPQLGEIERLVKLETIKPDSKSRLVVRRTYTATVHAYEKADLAAQVKGQVQIILPNGDIGRWVKKDEPLMELDIPDILADRENKKALLELAGNLHDQSRQAVKVAQEEIKEAQAQEKKYQAEVDFRSLQFTRQTQLAKRDTVSYQAAEEAELQLKSAQAALKTIQAQIQTKQARLKSAEVEVKVAESRKKVGRAELDRLNVLVGYATIRAPFDGVVTRRLVDTGAVIKDAGMPLLQVMRTDKVRVVLDIPERDVPHIHPDGPKFPGNSVVLNIPALQEIRPGLHFKGTVTLMARALDPVTRTMRTEVHLTNEGYLKPQMTGTASVLLDERKAMTIPSTALVRRGNRVEVFYIANPTADKRGIVKSKEVLLGLDDGLRVEILGNTLKGDELIIRKGNGVVRTGEQALAIEPREDK
jgi:RND family efflux transporter MFP subunit